MQVSYSLERKDLWQGALYTYTRHPVFLALWLVYGIVLGYGAWPALRNHDWARAALVAGGQFACCAAALFLATALTIWKRMPSRRTERPCTDEIDAWGYHCRLPEGVQRVAWRKVWQIADTPQHLFVFAGAGRGYPIPKRAFASPAEAAAFRDRALAYWAASRTGAAVDEPPREGVWPPAPKP